MRKVDVLWGVSGLLLAGFLIVMLAGIAFGVDVPEMVIRICGIGTLASLGAFSFMTYKKIVSKR